MLGTGSGQCKRVAAKMCHTPWVPGSAGIHPASQALPGYTLRPRLCRGRNCREALPRRPVLCVLQPRRQAQRGTEVGNHETSGNERMLIDFYGQRFEVSRVICYLWSPWRASAIEHRLFNEIKQLPGVHLEQQHDEMRVNVTDEKTFNQALVNMSRLLKGWQEEATGVGKEKRSYRWLIEGDTDEHGYDHTGDIACMWIYLRAGIERGDFDDGEPTEWVDLHGFGLRLFPVGR
jgi:hypothetical protein